MQLELKQEILPWRSLPPIDLSIALDRERPNL
jgi:hypothetical protein